MEDRITYTFKVSSIIGLLAGFLACLVVCAVGFYAIYKGFATQGASIIVGGAAAVITAFIVRKSNQKEDSK